MWAKLHLCQIFGCTIIFLFIITVMKLHLRFWTTLIHISRAKKIYQSTLYLSYNINVSNLHQYSMGIRSTYVMFINKRKTKYHLDNTVKHLVFVFFNSLQALKNIINTKCFIVWAQQKMYWFYFLFSRVVDIRQYWHYKMPPK